MRNKYIVHASKYHVKGNLMLKRLQMTKKIMLCYQNAQVQHHKLHEPNAHVL